MTRHKSEYQQPTHVLEPSHINAALDALTEYEREVVMAQAKRLADDIPRAGAGIALEILARIGAVL